MSEPTRDDLFAQKYGSWGKLTDAEFEAIVDADPRWVRAQKATSTIETLVDALAECEAQREGLAAESRRQSAQIIEMQKHWAQVTQDCDTCDGSGQAKMSRLFACSACGGSGKVPADGVEDVDWFVDWCMAHSHQMWTDEECFLRFTTDPNDPAGDIGPCTPQERSLVPVGEGSDDE